MTIWRTVLLAVCALAALVSLYAQTGGAPSASSPTQPALTQEKDRAKEAGAQQQRNAFEKVLDGVTRIVDWVWPIAVSMAAVGTLTMALIQTAKDIGGWRRKFHAAYLRGWLGKKAASFSRRAEQFPAPRDYEELLGMPGMKLFAVDAEKAEEDLIRLATANDARAFYDLPIEQLAGQMNAAVQAALDYPMAHRDLLWCLAHLAELEDILAILAPPLELLEKERDKLTPEDRRKVDTFVAARNRITHQVQRAIDGLQIAAGSAWKFRMQGWSMLLSAILGVLALVVATPKAEVGPSLGMFILTGIVAGFLAPVSRDLVAALQSLRK